MNHDPLWALGAIPFALASIPVLIVFVAGALYLRRFSSLASVIIVGLILAQVVYLGLEL
jgi:hypothetical protein